MPLTSYDIIQKEYGLKCDACACNFGPPLQFSAQGIRASSCDSLIKDARNNRWKNFGKIWICPDCFSRMIKDDDNREMESK